MSFSNEVKSEIISAITDKDKKFACLYGMIIFCKKANEKEICFQCESADAAKAFADYTSEIFKKNVAVSKEVFERKNGTSLYSFSVKDEASRRKISEVFRIDFQNREIDLQNIDNNNLSSFVAGVFLSCGSVTNPKNEYHLEFVVPTKQLYDDMAAVFSSIGLQCKLVMRKNSYILYFKESENIEDILTFMGAQNSTLELMDVKIVKDIRNRVNRVNNCEIANCSKTIDAAVKQKQDIELIDKKLGLSTLPKALQEMAYVRINNPEMSLKELGEVFDPPIGRSAVNHRLKRIAAIAENLRENK